MHQISLRLCSSSLITSFDGLKTALLIALNKAQKEAKDYSEGSINQD